MWSMGYVWGVIQTLWVSFPNTLLYPNHFSGVSHDWYFNTFRLCIPLLLCLGVPLGSLRQISSLFIGLDIPCVAFDCNWRVAAFFNEMYLKKKNNNREPTDRDQLQKLSLTICRSFICSSFMVLISCGLQQ